MNFSDRGRIHRVEFIVLMAAMAALDAFSIDAMMPALGAIGNDLGLVDANLRQYVITALFFGFSFGVLLYGFLSDRVGRRWPVLASFVFFIAASLLCTFTTDFYWLLAGRVLQGIGAAGPYVIAIAIVRDRYEGADMAQIMSLIMMVFIGVPMVAPFIGQGIYLLAGWRSIFTVLAIYATVVMLWFYYRQPETLTSDKQTELSAAKIWQSLVDVMTCRQTLIYLLCMSLTSGAFITYLSTAQQVFQDMYGIGTRLPVAIAALASFYGLACFVNSGLVHRLGMVRLIHQSLLAIVAASLICGAWIMLTGTLPGFWWYVGYMAVVVFAFGFLFENMMTLALEPMGHIAGAATSIVTSVSTLAGVGITGVIGSQLGRTPLAIVIGFAMMCGLAWGLSHFGYHLRQGQDG